MSREDDGIEFGGENAFVFQESIFSSPVKLPGVVPSCGQILRALHLVLRPEHFHTSIFRDTNRPKNREGVTGDAECELGIGFFFENPKSLAEELGVEKWGRGVDAAGEFDGRAVFLPPADGMGDDRQGKPTGSIMEEKALGRESRDQRREQAPSAL